MGQPRKPPLDPRTSLNSVIAFACVVTSEILTTSILTISCWSPDLRNNKVYFYPFRFKASFNLTLSLRSRRPRRPRPPRRPGLWIHRTNLAELPSSLTNSDSSTISSMRSPVCTLLPSKTFGSQSFPWEPSKNKWIVSKIQRSSEGNVQMLRTIALQASRDSHRKSKTLQDISQPMTRGHTLRYALCP